MIQNHLYVMFSSTNISARILFMSSKGNLLFFATEDWYFAMHFLHFAVAAQNEGWNVKLVCNTGQKGEHALEQIKAANINVIPLKLSRTSITPISDIKAFFKVFSIIKSWKPTLIHAVALKPILFCEAYSRLFKIPVLSMMTGLGFVFASETLKAKLIKPFMLGLLKLIFMNKINRLSMLNKDDTEWAKTNIGLPKDRIELLPGVGVDTQKFKPTKEPPKPFKLAYVGRMLKDKGLFELAEAIRSLKSHGISIELLMAGAPDPSNPASISELQIRNWQNEGLCSYHGHISDVPTFMNKAHALALPSYREGMPTCILEAAAAGLPAVSTLVPGCRDAVIDKETGYLVQHKNSAALAAAIKKFAEDPETRKKMGQKARENVIKNFSQKIVTKKILAIYSKLVTENN
jgi:glycosyltransferase involved in cell wall biosynthesis